jgi:hypothetical protein
VGFNWSNIFRFGKEQTKNKKEANVLQRVVVYSCPSASASAAKTLVVCLSLLRPALLLLLIKQK